MNKESLEHISSLMDGEISREAGLFLTRRLGSDQALSGHWDRYHLISDCIRQPGSKVVVTGMCEKLNESLHSESRPRVTAWQSHGWLKPVSGLAIAASVALMAIVVTAPQYGVLPGSSSDTAVSTSSAQPFVSPNTVSITPGSQAASYTADQKVNAERLNAYLLRHNQMARMAGKQGFVSFVPIVATPPVTEKDNPDTPEESAQVSPEKESVESQ